MADYKDKSLLEGLQELRFDIQDALLKVRQDRPIDMSGIDERVEYFCEEVINQPATAKDDIEPIMSDIISALEDLSYALQDALERDDEDDDWPEEDEPETSKN